MSAIDRVSILQNLLTYFGRSTIGCQLETECDQRVRKAIRGCAKLVMSCIENVFFVRRGPIGLQAGFDVPRQHVHLACSVDVYGEELDHRYGEQRCYVVIALVVAWIPVDLLADGPVSVDLKMLTPNPWVEHLSVAQTAAFQVVDQREGKRCTRQTGR